LSRITTGLAATWIALFAACSGGDPGGFRDDLGVEPARIEAHMRFLASDDLHGRETGTPGYRRAAEYVAEQFARLGLEPAATDGSFFQSIPLIAGTLLADESELALIRDGRESVLTINEDLVLYPDLLRQSAELTAPMVHVGFGVRAPEFEHDDYANVDVRGKIVVMFGGAPARFPNEERAFYSDGDLKARVAVEQGAVGIVMLRLPPDRVHYPWDSVVIDAGRSAMRWLDVDGHPRAVYEELFFVAMLSGEGEAKLLEGQARTIEQVRAAAEAGESDSFELTGRLRVFSVTGHEQARSSNVLARLPGSDPDLAAEHVVVTAHLDHVGSMPVEAGTDGIHNGAYDNASGVAIMLEVAETLAADPPRRSVLFLAPTGEEKGLLGSAYFTEHPSVALDHLVANINLDMVLMLHPLNDVVAFGAEHSTLEQSVSSAAKRLGIRISPDPLPELVLFIRSDQYPFVKAGVPSVFLFSGFDAGDVDGLEQFNDWMTGVYHTPGDDMDQPIDFEAGAAFARVNLLVVTDVANAEERPRWHAGDFFGERFARD
jgi:hypothetical protein